MALFWSRPYLDGMYLPCSREEIAERLALLDANRTAKYPLLAGWRKKHRASRVDPLMEALPAEPGAPTDGVTSTGDSTEA